MFSRITRFLNRDDERLLSILHDPLQRQTHLASLEQARMRYFIFLFVFLAIAIIGIFINDISAPTIVLLIGNAILYLDSDMKIKLLKLSQTVQPGSDLVQ